MDLEQLEDWLRAYGAAWENRDAKAAERLFSADASYYETPFGPPARGHGGVEEYWTAATQNQSNISFSWEIIGLADDVGFVRWQATFTRLTSNAEVALDGVFLLKFNNDGLCESLREWWHKREN
jgi:ketosteroid isomerase-like protein